MRTRLLLRVLALLTLALAGANPASAGTYKTRFVWLAPGVPGLFHEPARPGAKASTAVLVMHPTVDYLEPGEINPCERLAERGYRALCANASTSKAGIMSDMNQDKLTLNVKAAMVWLRKVPGVRRIVLFGHSGGGAMMAAYQNIAENGLAACQGPEKLIRCPESLAGLPSADGVMLVDSSMGMPVSNMISIDPAIVDENTGTVLAGELDMYNPANGFRPEGSSYSADFAARFFAGQRDRMNRLIASASARLAKIAAGQGRFRDDEPFVAPGAVPRENKLNNQDVRLLSRTRDAWPILHPDGSVTTGIVHTVRVPRSTQSPSLLAANALVTTVRGFLSTFAVRALPDYALDEYGIRGVDFSSSYGATYNNIGGISKPLLQIGFTGSYEFAFAEGARARATSGDKTLVYLEGAVHAFRPCQECAVAKGLPANAYGDTVKTLYNYIDTWLSKPGRF